MLNRLRKVTPVATRDRMPKARMIEAILQAHLGKPMANLRVLDIGCGNGHIARYFARENSVSGVDTVDRTGGVTTAFDFTQVHSEHLPFDDATFDVVLSHHVIEHVDDQALHLAEIKRVLRPGGIAYLATPNRSSPIMPGHVGNDRVLRYPAMAPLFEACGFETFEYSTRVVTEPDRFCYPLKLGRWIPTAVAHAARRLYPSHMFVLEPRAASPV